MFKMPSFMGRFLTTSMQFGGSTNWLYRQLGIEVFGNIKLVDVVLLDRGWAS